MEKWDVFNQNREKLDKVSVRGTNDLNDGEYHLVTVGWIFNSLGEVLMQKRSLNKEEYPGFYAIHGGSALLGETSKQSMVREFQEEIGIKFSENELYMLRTYIEADSIFDEYVVYKDIDLNELLLDYNEVDSCKWFTFDEVSESIKNNECYDYYRKNFNGECSIDYVKEFIRCYLDKSMVSFYMDIDDIIPQQHYLSKEKLIKVENNLDKYEDLGSIYVINYKDKYYSIDGHHRLHIAKQRGMKLIKVTMEFDDNDHKLYHILANEADDLGIKNISGLSYRIIETKEEYEIKWIEKCQKILKDLNKD